LHGFEDNDVDGLVLDVIDDDCDDVVLITVSSASLSTRIVMLLAVFSGVLKLNNRDVKV
jgi:hypothetical protein